jgi:4-oxalocrotonate tautomerase
MPHVIVKMWPGPSEQQIEEVQPRDWLESVYRPEIEPQMNRLYKKPGYGPSDL